MNLDKTKFVYLLLHGHKNLVMDVTTRLIAKGLVIQQIVDADPRLYANVGDYVADIEPYDMPTKIVIRKITKTETKPPQRPGDGEMNIIVFKDPPIEEFGLYTE